MKKLRAFWKDRFTGEHKISRLPYSLKTNRQAEQGGSGQSSVFVSMLPANVAERIGLITNGSSMGILTVLLTGVQSLLFKYTNECPVIFGIPVVNKSDAPLLNDVVLLKNEGTAADSFRTLLSRMGAETAEAIAHQDIFFETMAGSLNMGCEANGAPLISTLISYMPVHPANAHASIAAEITFAFEQEQEGIRLRVHYRTDTYDAISIERAVNHLYRLFSIVLFQPDLELGSVEIMTEAEKHQVLHEFNNTGMDSPSDKTIHGLFEEQAARTPEQIALYFEGATRTYRELNERANRLARTLRAQGVTADKLVGLLAERSLEMVVGLLAVAKAGGAYVPIDPTYPRERIRYMLADSGAKLLLTQSHLLEQAAAVTDEGVVTLALESEGPETEDGSNLEPINAANNLAYVIYTSGTTGQPKGVLVEHRGVSNLRTHMEHGLNITADERIIQFASLSFDASSWEICMALLSGATLYIPSPSVIFNYRAFEDYITEHGITMAVLPPTYAIYLEPARMTTLRKLVTGGSAASAELVAKWKDHAAYFNAYGPTEDSICSTMWAYDESSMHGHAAPIGRPLPNHRVYIMDPHGQLLPIGVPGELCVAGVGLARGYRDRPELTDEKFVTGRLNGERMYRTGDLARWLPDGNIEYLGRIDHQVKIRGYRIELGEVEWHIRKLEGVREAVVIAREDEQGQQVLCAYVVAERTWLAGELRETLGHDLPGYLVPTYFVQLDKMPLSGSGKIDRKALPAPAESVQNGSVYVAPRTELEAKLTGIWQDLLGLKTVGVHDHFFEIGGHSLRATTMVARIHKELNKQLELREIFQASTIEQLAQVIESKETREYEAIPKAPKQDVYPMSSPQKRLYILSHLEGGELGYNMPGITVVEGPLDRARLETAFHGLVARHDSLRTSFVLEDGVPVQSIHERVEFGIEYMEADEDQVDKLIEVFVRPFDLSLPPLLRVGLITLAPERHILLIDMHHTISDGASLSVLIGEFAKLYQGQILPPQRIQYKDYAVWQQSEARQTAMKAQEAYWLDAFRGEIPALDLKTDFVRPAVQSFAGDRIRFKVDGVTAAGLRRLATRTGSTLYMVLLAAYTALLHKYTGQDDIIVGTPIAGRPHADLESMIGMFVGTLAIRNYPTGDKAFIDYIGEVKERTLKAFENQEYPFEQLVEKLNVRRDMSRNALFDTMFELTNLEEAAADIDELRFSPYPSEPTTAKFDLTLEGTDEGEAGLIFHLEYATALYKRETAERLGAHYAELLQRVASEPQTKLAALEILPAAERAELLEVFGSPGTPVPPAELDLPLYIRFERQAEKAPNHPAVVYMDTTLTYGELNGRANRLARKLRTAGVGRESIVGIFADRSVDLLVAVLAVWKSGGAYVPLDPDYPPDRIEYMLEDSAAAVLLTQSHLIDRADAWRQEGETVKPIFRLDETALFEGDFAEAENLVTVNEPQDLAYVIYTSGTTGNPKGVMIEHRSLVNTAHAYRRDYRLGEFPVRLLQLASFSFDVFVGDIARTLYNGGTMIICPKDDRIDANKLYGWIRDYQVTVFESTPALIVSFMEHVHAQKLDFSSMQLLITSSDSCSVTDYHILQERFGSRLRIINSYGVTEAAIDTSFYDEPPVLLPAAGSVPIGKARLNARFYIVDAGFHQVPVGITGELCIGGEGVARGYLNRPDLSAEKFVDNPFVPGERLYRTGDLAPWMVDGNVDFIGRIDHQVKIRGFRIELGEVETAMLRFEGVTQAVVIDWTDERGQKYLCGYASAGQEVDLPKLQVYLQQSLPSHMVPARLMYVARLPLTSNGKIDRKALPEPHGPAHTGAEFVAPRNAVEETIAAVWQAVLGAQAVGIRDNFFELGGDSIKSLQVSSRLYQAGYKLQMKDLFQYPTVAALSPHVRPVARVADQGAVEGAFRLTPVQQWFFEQAYTDAHHHNQSVMLFSEQGFDEAAIRATFAQIAEHHDALRVVIRGKDGGYEAWNRGIDEGERFTLYRYDLTGEADQAAAVEAKATEVQGSIDMFAGPLLKLGLFRCSGGEHLLIAIHHLVMDGVSWRIVFEDFVTGYGQALKGEPIVLPQKTDSFRTWAQQLQAYANGQEMEQERAVWEYIEQIPRVPLPKDENAAGGRNSDNATVTAAWTKQETELLLKQANRAYNTEINDLLLTALGMAVHAWSGLEQVIVNLEGHGRESILPEIDITRTIGWFTSQYPVVLEMEAGKPVGQRIKAVKEHLRRIPQKGIGYGIRRYLSPAHSQTAFGAEPEISFNYLGQFDQDLQNPVLGMSPFVRGHEISLNTERTYVLDINGLISEGALSLAISYSVKQYREATMQRFADLFRASLREIIEHCAAQERTELTPSDVMLKGVTGAELDQLVASTRAIGEVENVYALTPMQKGMMFHSMMDAESGVYFEQTTFILQGSFDLDVFGRALETLAKRHEIFRANAYLGWRDEPVQVIYKSKAGFYHTEDLRGLGKAERTAYAELFVREDKARGFDLTKDALLRVSILQTDEDIYHFIWSSHHLVMDGWCLSLVTEEVFELYFAYLEGRAPQLAEVSPYSRYIEWLETRNYTEASDYWRSYLNGYEGQTQLPTGRPSLPESDKQVFGLLYSEVGEALTAQINRLAKQYSVTVNTVLQTVWGLLLQKYNNSSDAVFGSVVSGRPAEIPGIESMIGLFINTIPVRIRCEDEDVFANVLRKSQAQAIASNTYDTHPLYDIQAQTAQKQELINHIMVFENFPVKDKIGQLGGDGKPLFEINDVSMMEQTNYDLNLIVMPGDNLHIRYDYSVAVFAPDMIQRIAGHLIHVLEQVVGRPELCIGDLEVVTAEEKAQILVEFNDTAAPYPSHQTIYQMFEEQAALTPDRPAVLFEGTQLTYGELNERANRLARTLQANGVAAERKVGMMAERSPEMIVGIYAILKAGGAYVPIDPEYPADRVSFILEDADAALLLTQTHIRDRAEKGFSGTIIDVNAPQSYNTDGTNLAPAAGPNNVAYVIYTSGSTGKPKGVMIEHHSVINRILWMHAKYPIGEADTILQKTTFTFDVSVWELFWWALAGSKVCLLSVGGEKNPETMLETIERYRITTMHFVPAMLHAFLGYAEQQPQAVLAKQIGSLRQVFASGEALPPQHAAWFRQTIGGVNGARLINLYGPTEATIDVSYFDCEPDREYLVIPIGKPIQNIHLYVVKEGTTQLQPIGVTGELVIAGVGVARGYLNRPELSAEKFIGSPFEEGERMYRSGDLVRWLPDGHIEYLGRVDHQVKIRGYRIELGEIEWHMRMTESVQDVLVLSHEDESGGNQLCAYFTAARELAAGELRSRLAKALPPYMIPAHMVQLEQLPLTATGKIDRKALPAPDGSVTRGSVYAAPRTAAEQALVTIWQGVLGAKPVGIHDNFFDLGGDSIKSIQVSSRLLQAGYKLEMRDLFAYPTIAELSSYLKTAGMPVDQREVEGEVKLTPIMHWFFEQKQTDAHHFNQAVMLHREEGFDETALHLALGKLVEHHDALRLVFFEGANGDYSGWNRNVADGDLFTLSAFDVAGEADAAAFIEAKATEIQSGIDLANGPLIRVGLFRSTDGDHLLVTIHHLAVDGVSWRILFEDLAAGYEQALRGERIQLPHKTDSFQAWAHRLAAFAESDALQRELAYWLQLSAAEARTLPKDMEDSSPLTVIQTEEIAIRWSAQETEQLLKEAPRAYHTEVNDLLLTALGMAIYAWSGLERIAVNLEGHGREEIAPDVDVTRTVGWFTTQFPILLDIGPDRDIARRIKTVKEGLRRIPQKGIGYGLLKYLSAAGALADFGAEPEISFNYLGQFDQDPDRSAIGFSSYAIGEAVSRRTTIKYPLDVSGMVSENRLELTIRYNGKTYRKATIERLAALLKTSLQEIIAHCATKETSELTPSDLLYKGFTIEQMDRILELTRHLGEIENVYELTPMQKGLWFHALMEPGSGAYFEQATFEMNGEFHAEAFERALNLLVGRHHILRTSFRSGLAQEPLQLVFRRRTAAFLYEDIRELSDSQQGDYVAAFAQRDKAKGFDLAEEALMRVAVLRTGEEAYKFIWSFHHILMDGWCMSLMTGEVFGSYFAFLENKQPALHPVTPYSRYIEWLQRQDRAAAANYWKAYLAGFETQTELPQDGKADKAASYQAEKQTRVLGRAIADKVNLAAKRQQVTVNTLIQTAWGIVLQHYNNSKDVVYGTVVSGRPADIAGVESIIGLFINTIPVRVQTEGLVTFAEAMKRRQAQALASNAYDTYPLGDIQADTAQKQHLINHILVFENYPVEEQVEMLGGGGQEEPFSISNVSFAEQTNFDFNLIVIPGDTIRIDADYNAAVYERDTVARIQSHLIRVLEQVADNPSIPLRQLELITPAEKAQILTEFNDTAAAHPSDSTITRLFEDQAARVPTCPAVLFRDTRLTYGELNERANRLARTLQSFGVTAGSKVGIMVERSLEMLVGLFAILKAGGAYVPIDPAYPAERVSFILDDADAALLLTQTHIRDQAAKSFGGAIIDVNDPHSYDTDGANLPSIAEAADLAYVIYTSGSTGKPKGVMVEHGTVVHMLSVLECMYPLHAGDAYLLKTTYTFDVSVTELFGWFMGQGTLVVLPSGLEKDPASWMDVIEQYGITHLNLAPSVLTAWLSGVPLIDPQRVGSLKYIFSAGEALPPEYVKQYQALHWAAKLINLYGPTETTIYATAFGTDSLTDEGRSVPIGRPLTGVQAFIVDASMRLQPVGVSGELCIAGAGVSRGYVNLPELTAEKFVSHPLVPGGVMYRTGDLARWLPDGMIEYIGRIDRQVKIRGYRMELGEIESELRQLETVREAVVVAVADSDGQKQLCAYMTAPSELSARELRSALAARLPAYMVPAHFVQLASMPLTPSGKIDVRALPAPNGRSTGGVAYEAPSTVAEKQLAEIWQQVLGVAEVGVHDSFFELGGHSLKAITLKSELERRGYHVSLTDIYHYQTISALSAYLQGGMEARDLLASKEDLVSWLHEQTGEVYEWASYGVTDSYRNARSQHVLFQLAEEPKAVDTLVGLMRGRVSSKILPHYIIPLHLKADLDEQTDLTEEDFFRLLQLDPLGLEEAESITRQLTANYEAQSRWVREGAVLEEYPLGPAQQMQIQFLARPSMDVFVLDEYCVAALLDGAYAQLVQSQGLFRSVPIAGDRWTYWREYAYRSEDRPPLVIVDFSHRNEFGPSAELLNRYIEALEYPADPERVLYQIIVIKRNLREHFVLALHHHVISDRATVEVVERQFLTFYRELLRNPSSRPEPVESFAAYVRQIEKGPSVSEHELVSQFELTSFHDSKIRILDKLEHLQSDQSVTFEVFVPVKEHSLELALSTYMRGLQAYLGESKLPLLFVYEGRIYESNVYYNTIGEFIDFVPLVVDAEQSPHQMVASVKRRLDLLKQDNINFMHLLLNPHCETSWAHTRDLVHFGESFKHIDMFMFNYLGNSVRGESLDRIYDATVNRQPNPLPIQALFNCIAEATSGGFIFLMRCSYEVDVEEVRSAFLSAAVSQERRTE